MKKQERIVVLILSVILIFCSSNITVFAQSGWDGLTEIQPSGEGTITEPFLISSAEELAWYRTQINQYDNTSCAKLISDIDLNGQDWIPIGMAMSNLGYAFSGSFDGNGYTIKGLYINTSNVDSPSYVYGLFGRVLGVGEVNRATVFDLTVEGSIAYNRAVTQSAAVSVGGLVGMADKADIQRCTANVTVNVIKESNDNYFTDGIYSYVGGICGNASTVNFTDCINIGNVIGTGYAGGIAGSFTGPGTILRCCNLGSITGFARVGGIAGNVKGQDLCFEFCYNSGKVIALTETSGGLIGYMELSDVNPPIISVIGCFSTGNIESPKNAGGCFGYLVYYGGTLSLDNISFLDVSAENGFGAKYSLWPISVTARSVSEIMSFEFVDSLNDSARLFGLTEDVFKAGLDHPIFVWQPDEMQDALLGDIDGNGSINAEDVSDLIYAISKGNTLDPAIADINLDGSINATDASELIDFIQNR